MTQTALEFEPDLSRGRNNRRSAAAHERVKPMKQSMRERCAWFIACQGIKGATLEDLCGNFGKQPHQLSGRVSELKAAGRIFDSGQTRNAHSVYLSSQYRRTA